LCPTAYIIEKGRTVSHGKSPNVVREYLGLSVDEFAKGARFEPSPPRIVQGRSFERFTLDLEVIAEEDVGINFGVAVEVFVPGFGWEHVLHADPQPVGVGPGKFGIQLSIPDLPLKRGEYSISVSISKTNPAGGQIALDARAWTYNEGIVLQVEGPGSSGAVHWPISIVQSASRERPA
jgi:hypothetical protein